MSKEELLKEIDKQKEIMFLEQMKDYIDWSKYYKARNKLNKLENELLTKLAKSGETVIIDGKKYEIVINEEE